jgi:hypothetical protein
VFQRYTAQFPRSILQSFAQTLKALRLAERHVFLLRVRQHEVKKHMREASAADRDACT